ncbi:FG-GAP-like repeat-containing protein [Hymenobacter monticola]|uniref:FG-GAP-like repeat-containing protein n=1 Tax=Hymenobacter monticola TaxID=1705399 RepID=A0ABY4B3N0_9BACT|nr:FG-GAP-like repeat-containing protein [Hymenobacter monticola]UOE33753.1 FG-GAP-like repeat-containing protein [Hymenobacter monticola]
MIKLLPIRFVRVGALLALAADFLPGAATAQPIVTSLTPARNAQAAASTNVTAGLSQALDARSTRALRVFSAQTGGKKAGVASLNGNSLVFNPTIDFKAGETVWATLDTAARTAGRVPLAAPQVWQFTAASGGTGVFSGGTVTTVSGNAALVMGDVDGDGDLDLLTGDLNRYTAHVGISLNDGTGTFEPAADLPSTSTVASTALGDLDGDGDLDLVTSGMDRATNSRSMYSVYLNNGNGSFAAPVAQYGGQAGAAITLVDLDGDSDLDLVHGTQAMLNDGRGTFAGALLNSPAISVMAAGDVDNDGDVDILGITNTTSLSVRLNNGRGTFTSGSSSPYAGPGPWKMRTADVDGDGDLDVVTSNLSLSGNYSITILLNNGSGGFGNLRTLPGGADFVLSNLDADGDIDLLVLNRATMVAETWRNDGLGVFSKTADTALGTLAPELLAAADVDDDGDVDLIAGSGDVYVLRNGGNAPAPYAVTVVAPAANRPAARNAAVSVTFSTAMGGAVASGGAVRAFSAQAGGRKAGTAAATASTLAFAPATPFKPGEVVDATVSKTARSAAGLPLAQPYVWQFTAAVSGGTGRFNSGPVLSAGLGGVEPVYSTLADIDGDQDLDLVTSYSSSPNVPVGVRLNNGTGGFGASAPLLGTLVCGDFFNMADVDNDGDLDFVGFTVNGATTALTSNFVWLNNGQGQFTALSTLPHPVSSSFRNHGALGDIDGDGDLDMVDGYVRFNDGRGNFYGAAYVPNFANAFQHALADLDGDGDLDWVIYYNSINFGTTWYRNDGTGTFSNETVLNPRGRNDAIFARDLDGDGDVDLLESERNRGIHALFNNGQGVFSSGPFYVTTAGDFATSAVGDVDGDGDLDVIQQNLLARELLLNDGQGGFSPGAALPSGNGSLIRGSQPAMGDVDGDGDLDFIDTGLSATLWTVQFNANATASRGPQAEPTFQAWPNPVPRGAAIQIKIPQAATAVLTVRTLLGQTVSTQTLSGADARLDTGALAPGVYALTLQRPNLLPSTQRITIE